MTLVVLFGLGNVLQAFLLCRPFAKNWYTLLPGSCGSIRASVLSLSIINMTVDLIIVALPMPMIWRLQMAKKRKIGLTITFALGLL